MDPIALATLTSAVTLVAKEAGALASEAGKSFASEAGKTTWTKVKGLLGLKSDPKAPDLAVTVAETFQKQPELAKPILEVLKGHASGAETDVRALVGRIDAEKVVVVGTMNVSGDFNM